MFIEASMESGMKNFDRQGYKGVTETWNVLQHDVSNVKNFRTEILKWTYTNLVLKNCSRILQNCTF